MLLALFDHKSLVLFNPYSYQRAFGAILEHLQREYQIRDLAQTDKGLCFRLFTTRNCATTEQF